MSKKDVLKAYHRDNLAEHPLQVYKTWCNYKTYDIFHMKTEPLGVVPCSHSEDGPCTWETSKCR